MSKNLSARKKNQISLRNGLRNKIYKSSIRTLIKKYLISVNKNDGKSVYYLSKTYSKIDKAVKRNILHRNEGARKKAALNKILKLKVQSYYK